MINMQYSINASLQIIPSSTRQNTYALVDKAIQVIHESGLKYLVTPMETIVEGPYEEIMALFKKAQAATLEAGADELIVIIKLHVHGSRSISFEEKTAKWS
jgi:uncharacterized protein YqgV (UPF0045/DUF77 family)